MRLSTSMMYSNGLKGVLAQESDMNRLVEQVGSGKKFLTPADDPLSASLAINVAQTESMNSTYALNRNTAKTNLGQENNVLDSITTALADVRTRVVQAGNGTFADSDRQALSTALKNARDALLGLANSTDGNGQYLFSGYQGGVVPYSQDTNGKIVYSGATGERTVQVDQSRQMSTSDIGSDITDGLGRSLRLSLGSSTVQGLGARVFSQHTDVRIGWGQRGQLSGGPYAGFERTSGDVAWAGLTRRFDEKRYAALQINRLSGARPLAGTGAIAPTAYVPARPAP